MLLLYAACSLLSSSNPSPCPCYNSGYLLTGVLVLPYALWPGTPGQETSCREQQVLRFHVHKLQSSGLPEDSVGRRNLGLLLLTSPDAHCKHEHRAVNRSWQLFLHGSRVSVPLREQLTSWGCGFWERSGFKAATHSAVPAGVAMSFPSVCRY